MRRTGTIVLAACLIWRADVLCAQEGPALRAKTDTATYGLLLTAPERLPADWLKTVADPILQQRQQLRCRMEQRARESVVLLRHTPAQYDPGQQVGLWRWSAGNTGTGNWSPFPDRALDARTLRFPLPCDLRADKRPENVKALDRMRRKK